MRVTRSVLVELKQRRRRRTLRALGAELLRHQDPDDGFGYVSELKRDARKEAKEKGHTLGRFHARAYDNTIFNANCERCQALVCVNLEPRPGEPKIYGAAVKELCP